MFHSASIVFQGETEIIQLGKGALPEEHCSVDDAQGMSNELDIVIVQAGHPMTSDGPQFLPSTQSTDYLKGEQSGV